MPRAALAPLDETLHDAPTGTEELTALVRSLATHPGDAIERLELARIRWRGLAEEDFPDGHRFAFRHLALVLERPYPRAMDRLELLGWAAHLCGRIVEFAEGVDGALETAGGNEPRASGVRIRSTRRR
jgi:hypothetical protein